MPKSKAAPAPKQPASAAPVPPPQKQQTSENADSKAIAVRPDGPVVNPFRGTPTNPNGNSFSQVASQAPWTPDGSTKGVAASNAIKPAGRITSMASRLQEQLSLFTEGLAQSDAAILAGHDECARINDEQRQVNIDFSNNVMKMVREQQGIVETSKTRIETQQSTLRAVNAERDELIAEKDDLTKTVFEHKALIEEQGHEIEVAKEARKILEREIQAKDAQLEQTEKEVSALHEENARLAGELQHREASVEEAEERRGALSERNADLLAQLNAAEAARLEAEENIQRLVGANAALEEEIAQGESAVMALQTQTAESFASLKVDREQLLERNRALARQMMESQARLDNVRAEAEAIIREEQQRNQELERKHEEMLAELETVGGEAALRPMLVAAQQELRMEKERAAALASKNQELEAAVGAKDDAATRAERDVVPVAEVVRAKKAAAEEIEKLKVDAAAAEARVRHYEEKIAEIEARGAQWSGQKGMLESKLELINRSLADFEKNRADAVARGSHGGGDGGGEGSGGGGGETAHEPWQDLDLHSVAGYSDLASNISEIPNHNDLDGRGARAAKAQANKVKFEQMKAQRNQYKQGLRQAQQEMERMKAEITAVNELKQQVKMLQEATFL